MEMLKIILIAALILIAAIIVVILIINTKRSNIKRDIDDLNFRFNTIKSIPLAFKLSKAQAMAKRNDDTAESVKEYYERYNIVQKHIDELNEAINDVEDCIAEKDYREASKIINIAKENIVDIETEVDDIDRFLEQFSEEESNQRETSRKLKETFREVKIYIRKNPNILSIANDGIEKRVEAIEELFSTSEELMYVNDYVNSLETLNSITKSIDDLKSTLTKLPELISDTKGVIPALLDEVNRQYALARQRGVFTDHLHIDERITQIEDQLNSDAKLIGKAEIEHVEEHNDSSKEILNDLLKQLEKENNDFQSIKGISDNIANEIAELRRLENYITIASQNEKERFGLEDLDGYIDGVKKAIDEYQASYIALNQDIFANSKPASELQKAGDELIEKINNEKKALNEHKSDIDKNTDSEQRAKSQLMKLQVVLNEVEVKVKEYHLPTIAAQYQDDLESGRKKIANIKTLLAEVPIDIEKLNSALDETIDYIYKFYNNVNNIVGMAIMVENAIVFGNKYRSSYPEVERDLSKAEFSYLNGEYTKALTMAISCMEKLFPNKADTSYLENA